MLAKRIMQKKVTWVSLIELIGKGKKVDNIQYVVFLNKKADITAAYIEITEFGGTFGDMTVRLDYKESVKSFTNHIEIITKSL